ncbi:acyl carrier protein [Acaryochloris sp. 'Moss Beach']|uniref:acyl carrier protein n=1 Tax=Acaryochloris TaxID=155977 RepID=UPI001F2F1CDE|nr:acyl carrier protein [Acaryochloris sp. 'Moss Beach']UJB71377.1 acyl carrier protein [Acaryochloris sp. 'Moss Beach']
MANQEIEIQAKEIIADILDIDEDQISNNFSPENCDSWDSMNNLRMITALEKAFKIKFSMEEISSMTNMEAISAMISQKSL